MEQHRCYQKNLLSLGKKKEDHQAGSTPVSKMPSQRDNRAQGSTNQVAQGSINPGQHVSVEGPSGQGHRPTGPSQDCQLIVPGQSACYYSQISQTISEPKLSTVAHQCVLGV